MEYAEARQLVDRLPRFDVKPGLARIERLLDRLAHPERSFPAVHVTGTNGKGSVTAMLASMLQAAAYRTGRYTSPDLVDFRDRIVVDGSWIPEPSFASAVARLVPEFGHADVPSQFEVLTAVAFEQFRAEFVDVAAVEVGLGGRFDATNVVTPVLTVLTNVSLDHTALLGKTEPEIAWEKAGIAKPGVPMVVGSLSGHVEEVVHREVRAAGARLARSDVTVDDRGIQDRARVYDVRGNGLPARVRLPLLGAYQRDNLRVALAAVLALRDEGWRIPSDAVAQGLAAVAWPGRWEVVAERPTVILDGAHNPAGAAAAAAALEAWEPRRERRSLLLGVLSDKDVAGIAARLVPLCGRVAVCSSASPRALGTAELAALVERTGAQAIRYDSVAEGVSQLMREADPQDTILVTGSLTVVAEARRATIGRSGRGSA